MRRTAAPIAALAAGLALATATAHGADGSVDARPDNTFSPTTVTVNVGEKVTFKNTGGYHDVHFDDGQFASPSSPSPTPWTATRTFAAAGTYRFYCSVHGGPGAKGMSGTVVVVDPTATTTPPAPTTTTTAAASTSFSGRVIVHGATVRLRLSLSSSAQVSGNLDRRGADGHYSRLDTIAFAEKAGRRTVKLERLTRHHLRKGTYRLGLHALDRSITLRFAVT